MNTLKSKKGMSLVEVLIAMGLMGGVALMVSTQLSNSTKVRKKMRLDQDYIDLRRQIQLKLSDSDSCTSSLQNVNFNTNEVGEDAPYQELSGATMDGVPMTDFKVNKVRLSKIEGRLKSQISSDKYVSELRLIPHDMEMTKPRLLTIGVVLDTDTGSLLDCSATELEGDDEILSYWTQNPVEKSLSYLDGAIGVGTTSSEASLNVYRTGPGPELILNTDHTISALQYWVQDKREWATFAINDGSNPSRFGVNYQETEEAPAIGLLNLTKDGELGLGENITAPQGSLHIYRKGSGAELILDTDHDISAVHHKKNGETTWATFAYHNETANESRFGINYFQDGNASSPPDNLFTLTKDGDVGIGRYLTNPSEKLEVDGNIYANCYKSPAGNVGGDCTSDKTLKEEITPIKNALETILALNPVRYRYIDAPYDAELEYGLIAQEVEKVNKNWVHKRPNGTMSVNYGLNLTMTLVQALKEQQRKFEGLQAKYKKLKKQRGRISDLEKRIQALEKQDQ